MKLFRFLSEDDTSVFCHKVTAALNKGWELHGDPTYAFDAAKGVMRCGQAACWSPFWLRCFFVTC